MNKTNRIIATIILFAFLLNSAGLAEDTLIARSESGNANLAPPLVFSDLEDDTHHHKFLALAEIGLERDLLAVDKLTDIDNATASQAVKGAFQKHERLKQEQAYKENTVFKPAKIVSYFNQVEHISGNIFLIPVSVEKNNTREDYKLLFSTVRKDGGFPIAICTEKELEELKSQIIARNEIPKRQTADEEAIARYIKVGEKIDDFTQSRINEFQFTEIEGRAKDLGWDEKYPDRIKPKIYLPPQMWKIIKSYSDMFLEYFGTNLDKALNGKNLVFITVPDDFEGFRVMENDKSVRVWSHSSPDTVYIFLKQKALDVFKNCKNWDEPSVEVFNKIYLYIIDHLIHEVGAIYNLQFSIDSGNLTNSLNDAYEHYLLYSRWYHKETRQHGEGDRYLDERQVGSILKKYPDLQKLKGKTAKLNNNLKSRDYAAADSESFDSISADSMIAEALANAALFVGGNYNTADDVKKTIERLKYIATKSSSIKARAVAAAALYYKMHNLKTHDWLHKICIQEDDMVAQTFAITALALLSGESAYFENLYAIANDERYTVQSLIASAGIILEGPQRNKAEYNIAKRRLEDEVEKSFDVTYNTASTRLIAIIGLCCDSYFNKDTITENGEDYIGILRDELTENPSDYVRALSLSVLYLMELRNEDRNELEKIVSSTMPKSQSSPAQYAAIAKGMPQSVILALKKIAAYREKGENGEALNLVRQILTDIVSDKIPELPKGTKRDKVVGDLMGLERQIAAQVARPNEKWGPGTPHMTQPPDDNGAGDVGMPHNDTTESVWKLGAHPDLKEIDAIGFALGAIHRKGKVVRSLALGRNDSEFKPYEAGMLREGTIGIIRSRFGMVDAYFLDHSKIEAADSFEVTYQNYYDLFSAIWSELKFGKRISDEENYKVVEVLRKGYESGRGRPVKILDNVHMFNSHRGNARFQQGSLSAQWKGGDEQTLLVKVQISMPPWFEQASSFYLWLGPKNHPEIGWKQVRIAKVDFVREDGPITNLYEITGEIKEPGKAFGISGDYGITVFAEVRGVDLSDRDFGNIRKWAGDDNIQDAIFNVSETPLADSMEQLLGIELMPRFFLFKQSVADALKQIYPEVVEGVRVARGMEPIEYIRFLDLIKAKDFELGEKLTRITDGRQLLNKILANSAINGIPSIEGFLSERAGLKEMLKFYSQAAAIKCLPDEDYEFFAREVITPDEMRRESNSLFFTIEDFAQKRLPLLEQRGVDIEHFNHVISKIKIISEKLYSMAIENLERHFGVLPPEDESVTTGAGKVGMVVDIIAKDLSTVILFATGNIGNTEEMIESLEDIADNAPGMLGRAFAAAALVWQLPKYLNEERLTAIAEQEENKIAQSIAVTFLVLTGYWDAERAGKLQAIADDYTDEIASIIANVGIVLAGPALPVVEYDKAKSRLQELISDSKSKGTIGSMLALTALSYDAKLDDDMRKEPTTYQLRMSQKVKSYNYYIHNLMNSITDEGNIPAVIGFAALYILEDDTEALDKLKKYAYSDTVVSPPSNVGHVNPPQNMPQPAVGTTKGMPETVVVALEKISACRKRGEYDEALRLIEEELRDLAVKNEVGAKLNLAMDTLLERQTEIKADMAKAASGDSASAVINAVVKFVRAEIGKGKTDITVIINGREEKWDIIKALGDADIGLLEVINDKLHFTGKSGGVMRKDDADSIDPALGFELMPGIFLLKKVAAEILRETYSELLQGKGGNTLEAYKRFLLLLYKKDPALYAKMTIHANKDRAADYYTSFIKSLNNNLVINFLSEEEFLSHREHVTEWIKYYSRIAALNRLADEDYKFFIGLFSMRGSMNDFFDKMGIDIDSFVNKYGAIFQTEGVDVVHFYRIIHQIKEKSEELYQLGMENFKRHFGALPLENTLDKISRSTAPESQSLPAEFAAMAKDIPQPVATALTEIAKRNANAEWQKALDRVESILTDIANNKFTFSTDRQQNDKIRDELIKCQRLLAALINPIPVIGEAKREILEIYARTINKNPDDILKVADNYGVLEIKKGERYVIIEKPVRIVGNLVKSGDTWTFGVFGGGVMRKRDDASDKPATDGTMHNAVWSEGLSPEAIERALKVIEQLVPVKVKALESRRFTAHIGSWAGYEFRTKITGSYAIRLLKGELRYLLETLSKKQRKEKGSVLEDALQKLAQRYRVLILDSATASLLEQAWAKLKEASYTKSNTNKEQVMRALKERAGVKVDIDNLTVLTSSDMAAFGQKKDGVVTEAGLVGQLPKLVESGMKVAVIIHQDSNRDRKIAIIDWLNRKLEGKGIKGQIAFGANFAEIHDAFHGEASRYKYFKVAHDIEVSDEKSYHGNIEIFDITTKIKLIIEALGKACNVNPNYFQTLYEAGLLIARAA